MGTQANYKSTLLTDIVSYLSEENVLFFEAKSRNEVIQRLVDHLASVKKISCKKEFFDAILEREQVASTGIGMGIALPHAKLPVYDDFFIAIGILNEGIAWNALDKMPVRLVFLIGGPDDKQTHYLKILSQLTLYLRDEERRKKLLTLTNPEQIIAVFKS